MIVGQIVDIEKVQREANSEGCLSHAGLLLTRYNMLKDNPSLENIIEVIKYYRDWRSLYDKCAICGKDIPPHFARLMFNAGSEVAPVLLHAHMCHEGSHMLKFIFNTIKESKMVK